ncbi:MAG: Ger(x)C family spore germination protein [Bacillota bacterium]|nr:Ger(x)C family spore germination protein [Bacillota bacterium]
MRRLIIMVIISISMTVLSGCWDRMEIGSITFPVAMAMDRNAQTGMIDLYAQVVKTSVGPEGQMVKTFETLESSGRTLSQAMYRMTDRAEQRISWKHINVIVISENFARHGLAEVMDLLSRFTQIRDTSYLLVTDENLKELLQGNPKVDIGIPTPLAAITISGERTAKTKVVSLKDFFSAYLSEGREPVIPKVSIAQREGDRIQLEFNELGVFKRDKLVGFITQEETMGLLWVVQKTTSGNLMIPCSSGKNGIISINPLQTRSRIIPDITDKLRITIEVKAEYSLIEMTCPVVMTTNNVNEINRKVEEYVKKRIEQTIERTRKEFNLDVFGFGERVYRKYPQYWYENKDNWMEIYKDTEFKITVQAQMRRTGETSDSLVFEFRRGE